MTGAVLRIVAASAAGLAMALALVLPAGAAAATEYQLTVNVSGAGAGGVQCEAEGVSEPCEYATRSYPAGTQLTLRGEAEEGSEFAGWSGGTGSAAACTGTTTSTCKFTLEVASEVTATFESTQRALAINYAGEGAGEVQCKVGSAEFEPCEEEYPRGTHLTLKETPEEGSSSFAGWSGGTGSAAACTGTTTSTCKLTLEVASEVTATFDFKLLSLHIKKEGTGSGAVVCEEQQGEEPCKASYPYGTILHLRAEAAPGSEFAGWSGCDTVTGNECEVEFGAARTVVATFNREPVEPPAEYALSVAKSGSGRGTVRSSPGGISCGATCSASFVQGTTVVLTGVPATGSQAVRWSGCDSVDAEGRCVVAVGGGRTVVATFDVKPPPPPPQPEPPGTATVAPRAHVRGDHAMLRLSCGGGPCKGAFKLTARLRRGAKSVVIGRAPFNLPAGASKAIPVRLSAAARRALKRRGTLRARLTGSGIAPGPVRLLA